MGAEIQAPGRSAFVLGTGTRSVADLAHDRPALSDDRPAYRIDIETARLQLRLDTDGSPPTPS